MCGCVGECLCALVLVLHIEDKDSHSTHEVRTILGSEDVLAGSSKVKSCFKACVKTRFNVV